MEPLRSTDIPLQPRPSGWPVPLTASQQRMWNRYIKGEPPLSDLRMCAVSVRLSGPLNISFLKRSIESVVQRHESLRTKITTAGSAPLQHIDAELHDYLEFIDLTNISTVQRDKEAARLGQEFMEQKIDVSVGPLFEAKLLKLSDQDHVLLIGVDHIISDEASHTILNRDIWSLYCHAVDDRPFSLQPLSIQFPDYAVWQQNTYGIWLEEYGRYWKQHLSGAPRTRLIPDNRSPKPESPTIARLHFPFGKTLSTKLYEIAQREQIRLPLVVLMAYVSVMSRWCNQRELLISFVSHGRHGHADLKNMIGPLANVLYLRLNIDNDDSFLDVLKKVHRELDSAHQHRDFDRVPNLIPDCATDLCFNWLPVGETFSYGHQRQDDRVVKARPFPLKVDTASIFFAPFFTSTTSGINVTVAYCADLFTQNTVEQFGKNLRWTSEEFARNPLARVNSVAFSTY